jgi:hypothetical protein
LFAELPAAELERLARTSADLHIAAGEFAVPEGGERALFAVPSGRIEVVKTFDEGSYYTKRKSIGPFGVGAELGGVLGADAVDDEGKVALGDRSRARAREREATLREGRVPLARALFSAARVRGPTRGRRPARVSGRGGRRETASSPPYVGVRVGGPAWMPFPWRWGYGWDWLEDPR